METSLKEHIAWKKCLRPFKTFDRKFLDNVILQVKNGPMNLQVKDWSLLYLEYLKKQIK